MNGSLGQKDAEPVPAAQPGILAGAAARLRKVFFDPLEPMPLFEHQLKVRLLSGLLISISIFILLGILLGAEMPWWIFPSLLLAYMIGRTRFYPLATVAVTLVLFLPSYRSALLQSGLDSEPLTAAFSWQLIPVVFCTLILPWRWLVALLGVNLAGMLVFPLLTEQITYSSMAGAYAVVGWVSVSVLVVQRLRDRLEQDRQESLRLNEARYRGIADQLATINEISRAVSSLNDLPDVLELIYQQVQRIIPLDSFILSLFDAEKNLLSFPFIFDDGQRLNQSPLLLQDEGRFAQLLHDRQPLVFNRDPKKQPLIINWLGFGRERKEAQSLMIVPLRKGETVLGSVTVQSFIPYAYTQEHLNILVGIGNQAATAIENARLYDQLQAEIYELNQAETRLRLSSQRAQALTHLSDLLAKEQRALPDLLQTVADYISALFHDVCLLNLVSSDGVTCEAVTIAGPEASATADLRSILSQDPASIGSGLSAYVLGSAQAIFIPDFEHATKSNYPANLQQHFSQFNVRSVLVIPLRAHGQTLGLINLWRYRVDQPFNDEDQAFFIDVGDRVALGILNTRLYMALQAELAERTRAETEVRTLNVELEQRVRERTAQLQVVNQELESFSYSVSHDLRAPLRVINGYSNALQEDYSHQLDANANTYLERILIASRRMSGLIDDLLNLSRISRSEMRFTQVDLAKIAGEIIANYRLQEPQRAVEFLVPPTLTVRADPNLMRSALDNLLGNAWKFTSRHPSAHIELGATQQNGEQIYYVRDDGAGFDMAYHDRLFVEFQRLHSPEQFDGTGIGLVIVRRIIHRHGGRIWAEGEPEKGASFFFTLGEF